MKIYEDVVAHYENCFDRHGDSHKGVDWPNKEDAEKRYEIIYNGLKSSDVANCLDFGSGLAHFYEYLLEQKERSIKYSGLELSKKMFTYSGLKYPEVTFFHKDVINNGWDIPRFDAVVMNGVFTEKLGAEYDEFYTYFEKLLSLVFNHTNKVVIFNLMSKQVDWERDDLFHVSLDKLAWTIKNKFSRNFIIRNDYGLYEYFVYLYK